MARSLSPEAEIVGRGHQAATHVLLPNPINHHSRRQRIGRVSQPTSQFQSSARGHSRGHSFQAECGQGSTPHPLAGLVGLAPNLNHGIPRSAFGHAIGQRKRTFHQERF